MTLTVRVWHRWLSGVQQCRIGLTGIWESDEWAVSWYALILVSSADGAGMDHPSRVVEADGNYHGYDVGLECDRIRQKLR